MSAPEGTIVVTGAAGKLGTSVVARLHGQGWQVRPAVQHAGQLDHAGPGAVAADLTSLPATIELLAGAGAVIHLAALTNPSAGPAEVVFANNTISTFHVLHAARLLSISNVVLASSVAAYGLSFAPRPWSPRFAPISEEHELAPGDPYGLSKQVGELTAAAAVRAEPKLCVVALRLHWICTPAELRARVDSLRADPAAAAHELWGYVDRDDAAEVVARSLSVTTPGLHTINVCAADTLSEVPSAELLRRYHPHTQLREPVRGHASLWSTSRCASLLGYRPTTTWRE